MTQWRRVPAALLVVVLGMGVVACRRGLADAAASAVEPQQAIQRISTQLSQKNLAVVDDFADDADVVMVGSGAGELAIGRQQITELLRTIYAGPALVRFEWRQTRSASRDDVAWVFADGDVVITAGGKDTRLPYRLTGVLERRGGAWKWRQFHGSQPAMP